MNDALWFLDSKATHHVASNDDSMNTISEYSGHGKLTLCDGSKLPITHWPCHSTYFAITWSKKCLKREIGKQFSSTLITKNLINISNFTVENDVVVEFNSTNYYIKDKISRKTLM